MRQAKVDMGVLKLYHGSSVAVPLPRFDACRPHNDYGQGFYCTHDVELAKEWACQRGRDGFVSAYELDTSAFTVLDLNAEGRCVLHWLAVLLEHRLCRLSTPTMIRGTAWLARHFSVDSSQADSIKGYRADDSYFGFARAFLRNEITLDQLSAAMKLGKLGEQHMIQSPAAFGALRFAGSEPVESSVYWARRESRDEEARAGFRAMLLQDPASPEHAGAGARGGGSAQPLFISALMAMSEEELHACLQ